MFGKNNVMFFVAILYAKLYIVVQKILGLQIPGLGYLLRLIKTPTEFNFLGRKMYFEPTVASCYGLHIVGQVHEPESHAILNLIFNENT